MLDRVKLGAIAACWILACSRDVATGKRCTVGDRSCSRGPNAASTVAAGSGSGGSVGASAVGRAAGSGGVGSSDSALTLHVEDIQGMTIEIITLACAGDCADVEAVAHGGNPPYAFQWEDGSTMPGRQVCLDASTTLQVSVRDTAIDSGEFHYDAHSTSAEVSAKVLDCGKLPDAGADCGDSAEASFVVTPAEANPSGNWSYGWSQSLGAMFTRYPTFYPATPIENGPYAGPGWPAIAQWFDQAQGKIGMESYYSVPPVPDVQFNATASAVHPAEGNLAGSSWTVAPGQFAMSPGTNGQYSIARWTAPQSGIYTVSAAFEGLCGDNDLPKTTADAHVQHNSSDLASGNIDASGTGNTFAFVDHVQVAAGDTIDFALGSAGAVFICPDVTALHASVCKQ